MQPSQTELLNVCIIPPTAVTEQCVLLSKELSSTDTLFTVDGIAKFPHMTLYMARFPNGSRKLVVDAVEDSLQGRFSFACTQSGFHVTEGGYGEVSYTRTNELLDVHENIISVVKEFRYSPENPYVESYFGSYSAAQKINACSTGYDLAHDLYRPHTSLTRYTAGKIPDEKEFLAEHTKNELSFTAHTICVYVADENGAAYERLAMFALP
jgi:hypothetical protein